MEVTVSRLFRTLAFLGLVYVILRPVSANEILLTVLAGIGMIAAVGAWFSRLRLAPQIHTLIYVQIVFGLLFSTLAALNSNPGLVPRMLVYLAAPLLFWTWVKALTHDTLKLALRWIAIATTALAAAIVVFVVGELGLIPISSLSSCCKNRARAWIPRAL